MLSHFLHSALHTRMALPSSLSPALPVAAAAPSAVRPRRFGSCRGSTAVGNAARGSRPEANAPGSTRAWDRCISRSKSVPKFIQAFSSDANSVAGNFDGHVPETSANGSVGRNSIGFSKPAARLPYLLSIAGVLIGCAIVYALIISIKDGPSTLVAAIAKSGFTAAFSLIFVSEIGDKTFFIAALLAMQYDKALVLLGSMGALAFMTGLSVIIGRIFKSVPSQFQTTLPIGEYAAIALLVFFGLTSIKNAWELPSDEGKNSSEDGEVGELAEAEELVKEKVATKLTNPFQIIWKSFSLVFFAEWGDRSMLATIALGAAQSPWGVASGAIAGHLFATGVAVLGGSLLARYISEKLVGYFGGALFLVFAAATLLGIF